MTTANSTTQQIELEESDVEARERQRESEDWAFRHQALRTAKAAWEADDPRARALDTVIHIATKTEDNTSEIRVMKRNVAKTASAVNKLSEEHGKNMRSLGEQLKTINGKLPSRQTNTDSGRPKDTLRIPTPLGRPIEVPGARIRDATRLIAILAVIWLAWHVIQMRQEQAEQGRKLKAIAMPRVTALSDARDRGGDE